MIQTQTLRPFGQGAQKARVPVALMGQRHLLGSCITNTYFQEILGPRTFGAVLNIGAGRASVLFRQREMFAATEYHTLEPPGDVPATYHARAENMDSIASERYDWVISTDVFEHLEDPWAAAREALRVTKPGGFIYTLAPFSHQIHVGATYGDYWRFTPGALARLFPGCRVREVEVWGDDPIMANEYAVLVQKPPFDARAPELHFWLDFPNEDAWRQIVPGPDARYEWTVYQLLKTPDAISSEMHVLREQMNLASGVFVPIHQVTRGSIERYARRIGTVGFRGDVSFIHGDAPAPPSGR